MVTSVTASGETFAAGAIDLRPSVAATSPAGLALDTMMDSLHEALNQVQSGVGAITSASLFG